MLFSNNQKVVDEMNDTIECLEEEIDAASSVGEEAHDRITSAKAVSSEQYSKTRARFRTLEQYAEIDKEAICQLRAGFGRIDRTLQAILDLPIDVNLRRDINVAADSLLELRNTMHGFDMELRSHATALDSFRDEIDQIHEVGDEALYMHTIDPEDDDIIWDHPLKDVIAVILDHLKLKIEVKPGEQAQEATPATTIVAKAK